MEGPSAKKAKIEFNPDNKVTALTVVLKYHWIVLRAAKLPVQITDLDLGSKVSSLCFTLHTILRQQGNGKGGVEKKVDLKDTLVKILNPSTMEEESDIGVTVEEVLTLFKAAFKKHGGTYGDPNSLGLVGSVQSILGLITAWSARGSEVRSLPTTIETKEKKVNIINNLNLKNADAVFLNGITFSPLLKAAVAQTLGPMTLCYMYKTSVHPFAAKWERNLNNVFKLIPMQNEIIDMIGGKAQPVSLFSTLIDTCRLGVARNSNKAYIPYCIIQQYIKPSNLNLEPAQILNYELTGDVYEKLKQLDFSGKGLFWMLKEVSNVSFQMRGPDSETMLQFCIHAMLGSHLDDLTFIEEMTGKKFKTRKEIGDTLKDISKKNQVSFKIPLFKKWCKLASAATTSYVNTGRGQDSRMPVFAGSSYQLVNTDDDFILRTAETTLKKGYGRASLDALDCLNNFNQTIREKVGENKRIVFGTTQFFTYGETIGEPIEIEGSLELKKKYFFGSE